jgi:hypothetical protein
VVQPLNNQYILAAKKKKRKGVGKTPRKRRILTNVKLSMKAETNHVSRIPEKPPFVEGSTVDIVDVVGILDADEPPIKINREEISLFERKCVPISVDEQYLFIRNRILHLNENGGISLSAAQTVIPVRYKYNFHFANFPWKVINLKII